MLFLYLKQGTERIAEYSYDALGRRIERKKYTNDTLADTRRYYYNDSWQELYETNVAGQTETGMRYYVWGNYIDELLISSLNMLDSYWDFYYAHDHLYSPTCLMDSTGSVQERYEYDAYGKVHIYNASWAAGISGWENEYFFTGRRLDILDAGSLKIQYSRNRYYSPTIGRFLSRDPLGITPAAFMGNDKFSPAKQYTDGQNIYQYVKSQPISLQDEYGLYVDPIRDRIIRKQSSSSLSTITAKLKSICDKYPCCRGCPKTECYKQAKLLATNYYNKLSDWIRKTDEDYRKTGDGISDWFFFGQRTYNYCTEYSEATMGFGLNSDCFMMKLANDKSSLLMNIMGGAGHQYVGVFHKCNGTNHSDANLDPWTLGDFAHCPRILPGSGGDKIDWSAR